MSSRNFFKFSSLKSPRSHFGAIGIAFALCPLLLLGQTKMELPPVYFDTQPKPYSASFFKFTSLGYSPALVDWMWIQTLQIIGGRKYPQALKPMAKNFYNLATDLDPGFYNLYEQGGVFFSVLFKSTDDAIEILEKGIRNIKPSWNHPYTLHLLLFTQYAFGKQDWTKAKEIYIKAADLPGSPPHLQNVKKWMNEAGGEKRLAKQVLKILMESTDDDFVKEEYRKQLEQL